MSDQRRMVPSETPSACAACEVDRPSGLPFVFLMHHIASPDREGWAATAAIAQPLGGKSTAGRSFCANSEFWRLRAPVLIVGAAAPTRRGADRIASDAPAPPPPPRRRAHRLPRDRDGPRDRAPALARPLAPRVGADRRAARRAAARRRARPAAARRLRGPPAPPVLAGVADRCDRRVLPRGRRRALPDRRP